MTFQDRAPANRAAGVPARHFLAFTARILGNGRDSGGLHAVELDLPAGEASPWHTHHDEDEWFFVTEGEIEVRVAEARVTLGAGDFAFGPRDVPHGFRVLGDRPARVLLMTHGGRFSDFIAENSTPEGEVPRAPDLDRLVASARRYGQEIHGPLPT
ncbi:cupin domain-containing protein [Rhodobacterales bacterium HKCCE2091]|nr:cupin domain-containing protein [Rhodobacterales bacterium HKCCE2091]